jgi:hypothetical protein
MGRDLYNPLVTDAIFLLFRTSELLTCPESEETPSLRLRRHSIMFSGIMKYALNNFCRVIILENL